MKKTITFEQAFSGVTWPENHNRDEAKKTFVEIADISEVGKKRLVKRNGSFRVEKCYRCGGVTAWYLVLDCGANQSNAVFQFRCI